MEPDKRVQKIAGRRILRYSSRCLTCGKALDSVPDNVSKLYGSKACRAARNGLKSRKQQNRFARLVLKGKVCHQ